MSPALSDPWSQVEDIYGNELYTRLGLSRSASAAEVRTAFRALARQHHPDKGGDATHFAALRAAFEVLSDPASRAAYDELASQLKYRRVTRAYVPGVTPRAPGGESELLDELERLGLRCEPATQLVCVCEVCTRPATKECFVCTMRFCEFCTRKPHWKGKFKLHWPVHNSPHMLETLGRKELEKKRIEDGERAAAAAPHWRSEAELKESRAFKEAAVAARAGAAAAALPPQCWHDPRLGRYYMWAQTDALVFVAVHVPTGFAHKALRWEASRTGLRVQAEDSAPVVDRHWAHAVDADAPADAFRSEDNRLLALTLHKATRGEAWACLFAGDSVGARCLRPPYALAEGDADVLLEWPLPGWVQADDVAVEVTHTGLVARVRGLGELRRTFWEDADARSRRAPSAPPVGAVDPPACAWALRDDGTDDAGERCKALSLVLVKPPLTRDEIQYRRGVRLDNRAAQHPGYPSRKGARFFEDDADAFGLEAVLQALCFAADGCAWVPPLPHEAYQPPFAQPHWARREEQLSKAAREQLATMRKAKEADVEA